MAIQDAIQDLNTLLADFNLAQQWKPHHYDDVRTWSYGDVENNGVYYHPQLTHYAHQVFEQFFYEKCGLHYADLSGRDPRHQRARQNHSPSIQYRMTFPVQWLHQWMLKPMQSGDIYKTWIDTIDLSRRHIGVRAHVHNEANELAAVVIWVRKALRLEPKREPVVIPEWFPRRYRGDLVS